MAVRQVAYAQEGIVDDSGDYVVVFVDENEAGYTPTTYTSSDLAYCEAVAENINTRRGYSHQDVLDVVASSFAAQNAVRRPGRQQ